MIPMPRRWLSPQYPEGPTGRRALIEGGDPAARWVIGDALSAEGFEVATCDGPGGRAGRCPLTVGRECTAAACADVVVNLMNVRSHDTRAILTGIRGANPAAGVVVMASPYEVEKAGTLVADTRCTVVSPLASASTVAAAAADVATAAR